MDNPVTLTISDTQDVTKQNKTEHKRKLEMMNNTNPPDKKPGANPGARKGQVVPTCY